MIQFGFPLQYVGGVPSPSLVTNHSSALRHPEHVKIYIDKELSLGALVGPFSQHPFDEWKHLNPLMTRPKSGGQQRVIVDLAHLKGYGVNAGVIKGYVFGNCTEHTLPNIQDALTIARAFDFDVLAAVIDIERAYRNYRADPLDWPLLIIEFDHQFYIDIGLPFGARLSSLYVQKIPEFLMRALSHRHIKALVYLDDLYFLFPKSQNAHAKFAEAMAIIRSLGLPINYKKLVAPVRQAVWLGVQFDFDTQQISIPQNKVEQLLSAIRSIARCQYVKYREAQSIIGRIAHVAKVIPPARLFMARILQQLRSANGGHVYINHAVMADLNWFTVFFVKHNATSVMQTHTITATIQADSSLIGGGLGRGKPFTHTATLQLWLKSITYASSNASTI